LAFVAVTNQVQAGQSPATCVAVDGALLAKTGDMHWRSVKANDDVPAGALLVALPKAELASRNGAVGIHLLADIGQRGPFPVLESAVILHPAKDHDLNLTVDRGIVVLVNRKKKGAAKVCLGVRGQKWEVDLKSPGAKVAVEIYSRHVPSSDVHKEDDPTTYVVMIVVEGKAFVDSGAAGKALRAPPGPAMVVWDSIGRQDEVRTLDELPQGIKPKDEKEKQLFKDICHCTAHFNEGKTAAALDHLLKSERKTDRLVGVTALGALDEVEKLLGVLANPHHADARDHAILVLRHWAGRSPGQLKKLQATITGPLGYTPVQAKNFLHLLIGLTDQEKKQEGSLEFLVDLLNHRQLPVRELARWHLVRLIPEGQDIVYDAAAAEPERLRAMEQWRKLLHKTLSSPSDSAK